MVISRLRNEQIYISRFQIALIYEGKTRRWRRRGQTYACELYGTIRYPPCVRLSSGWSSLVLTGKSSNDRSMITAATPNVQKTDHPSSCNKYNTGSKGQAEEPWKALI